jgi:hypothetical protein
MMNKLEIFAFHMSPILVTNSPTRITVMIYTLRFLVMTSFCLSWSKLLWAAFVCTEERSVRYNTSFATPKLLKK